MKLLDYILLFLLSAAILYYFLFPNVVIDKQTEYIKGDTVTTVINQEKFDSLTYHFKAQIQKLKKSKTINVTELVEVHDTTYLSFWSMFNLGDSLLGTSGRVTFNLNEFKFDSVKYRYPEKLKAVTDTLKITNQTSKPFFLDEWFYTSVALFLLLLSQLGS
jgi:hypothetical protein